MGSLWWKKHENRLAAGLLHPLGSLSVTHTPSRMEQGRVREGVARQTGLSLEGRERKTGKGRWKAMEGRRERKDDEKRVEILGRIQTKGRGRSPLDGLLWGFSINKRLVGRRHFTANIFARCILHSVKLGKQ